MVEISSLHDIQRESIGNRSLVRISSPPVTVKQHPSAGYGLKPHSQRCEHDNTATLTKPIASFSLPFSRLVLRPRDRGEIKPLVTMRPDRRPRPCPIPSSP
jgi:hypothetical protein